MKIIATVLALLSITQAFWFISKREVSPFLLIQGVLNIIISLILIFEVWFKLTWLAWSLLILFSLLFFLYGTKIKTLFDHMVSLEKEFNRLKLGEDDEVNITAKEYLETLRRSPVPKAILNKDLKYLFINEAYFKTFKLYKKGFDGVASILGKTPSQVFPAIPKHYPAFLESIKHTIQSRKVFISTREFFTDIKGNVYYCDWTVVPINTSKVLITVIDKTKEVQEADRAERYARENRKLVLDIMENPSKALNDLTLKTIEKRKKRKE